MPGKKRPTLTLDSSVTENDMMMQSYDTDGHVFVKGDMKINTEGLIGSETKSEGLTYDQIEFKEHLGQGCSGSVKRGLYKKNGKEIAVKFININEKANRDQLVKELHVLSKINCVTLVHFYGAFLHKDDICIAIEFMDRGSLDAFGGKGKTIPEVPLAGITYQVLWALGYLTVEKKVHRDIKPQNILVNNLGQVKVTDFGISKELGDKSMCSTFVGTFRYMSPERMEGKEYSYPSDIWSLGIVVYECVSGVFPYESSDTEIDLIRSIIEDEPPPLPDFVSPELKNFISICLQKNPNNRLPAQKLLASEWLQSKGAKSVNVSVEIVKNYLVKLEGGESKVCYK